jgi:ketosteroid isomerase-like protein
MKNKILIVGLLVLILTPFLGFTQKEKVIIIDKEKVKAEIQAIEDKFALTFNNRNADSITYYAEDAISYFPGQEPIAGITAIHQHIKNELIVFPEGATISFETLEIYVTNDGNNVAEFGAHKLVDSNGKVLQKGHYVSFFAKRNGRYVCVRDMANSVQIDNE